MYLINTKTLRLEAFVGSCPPYAILSHTWGPDEFTFAEFDGESQAKSRNKEGFRKISRTCEQARRDGLDYAWVDTCCINQQSSSELSEAINSMFNWYSKAALCYSFIEDLDEKSTTVGFSTLKDCRWFSRGWTLQELLALSEVIFYGMDWIENSRKKSMHTALEQITGIPGDVLDDPQKLASKSIAARMSWAAGRETTREEDMAYCLLGVFDVNIPMLYGEGKKAFIRLQEEIMRQSDDDFLFTWRSGAEDQAMAPYRGLFSSSPKEFSDCADIHFFTHLKTQATMLGNGRFSLSCDFHRMENNEVLLGLKCFRTDISERLGITVVSMGENTYMRSNPSILVTCPHKNDFENILIKKHVLEKEVNLEDDIYQRDSIHLRDLPDGVRLVSVHPKNLTNSTTDIISILDAIDQRVAFELVLVLDGKGHSLRNG